MAGGGARANWTLDEAQEANKERFAGVMEDFVFLVKDGVDREQIAERMGVKPRTVERWFSKARKRGLLDDRS